MTLPELITAMPFCEHLGIEVSVAADGCAEGSLELGSEHSSVPGRAVAHGGVAYSLADTVGGAAVISLHRAPTPTVDMRMDYLAPARTDLVADAEVVRDGGSVAVADVVVRDAEGTRVATARGVYKTGGGHGDTAWGGPVDGERRTAGN
ncbi:PaaI family thioesterase [Halegenticoccus soli]|uniref:PaaI family thioesterase n=1 Tax=Halegenticoccus soli TaxID=1985678 RepID=UPI000C6E385B|nr:PaaI family thioesterase [Halegenticoccus soli]